LDKAPKIVKLSFSNKKKNNGVEEEKSGYTLNLDKILEK